ncbi:MULTISPECIES: DUF1302 domain-containing protein [Pseudomonas]|uniref:DUF1302 domain-containing protein n=1 Tax=Pseudomonas TaxID=286 RepID=UPI001E58D0FB|nr:DUF1302 domain-containing protein [Pseudomonas juntendi]EKT4502762.1 DUF1302 domain-containing protein [Pseudomonas putida]MCK1156630.1 DUF1302 domain-containing protein [Pseudomonas aeruginosa]MDM3893857.1 DUF1302 domain-containing protein [Pseudomonas juntendi]
MRPNVRKVCVVLAGVSTCAGYLACADAAQFKLGESWEARVDSTVSVGSGWRTESPDKKLYTRLNGERVGLSGGLGAASVDSGNLNYRRGDRFSTQYKLLSDLQLSNGEYGGFLRLKGWYDDALENSGVQAGAQSNGYQRGKNLEDSGVARLAHYKGFEALDSYVWSKFTLVEHATEARLGRQTIPFGGSLFFQGLNQVNPMNISALRKPGVDLQREMFIPTWSAYGKVNNVFGGTLEAFYQIKWEPSVMDSCSTYWSPLEMGLTTKAGSACEGAALLSGASSATQFANGNYLPLGKGKDGSDNGQFGLSYHYQLDSINTDLGLYYTQINARMPIISARMGDDPPGALINGPKSVEALGLSPAEGFWEYPDHIRTFGITTKTKMTGWVLGSELSYTPNQPVQRSANDIVLAVFQGRGPLAEQAQAARLAGNGTDIGGYDRLEKTQFLVNGVKPLGPMLGAKKGLVVGEVATQYTNVGDAFSDIRYGRGFIFGNGAHESLGGGDCLATNPQPDGCKNDGYVTRFSWGYRLKAQLDYSVDAVTGLWVSPNLYWAHDVNGYSSDSQLVEGRTQLGMGMKFSYSTLTLDLNYVTFDNSAEYDPFRDHDFASVAISYGF